MVQKVFLAIAVVVGFTAYLAAQTAAPGQEPPARSLTAAELATKALTDSDLYCDGHFTHRPVESGLFVLGSEDGALKFEFSNQDIIYLSKGRKSINVPGGQYMVMRPVKDIIRYQSFPGQHALLSKLGTLYSDIARIQIQTIHENSASAKILTSCESVLEGDIVVPFVARSAPAYRSAQLTDRFAPSSGKATGIIAAIKEFQEAAGAGNIVYLNMGLKQGVQVGSYLRIFQTYRSPSQYLEQQGSRNYLTDLMGVPIGHKLTQEEIDALPRTVLGEMMILSAEDDSATAIITYSWQDIHPGDQVEIE